MSRQKFHKGDLVHIAADLSADGMGHFESDVDAIVLYSYAEKYGGGSRESQDYSLFVKGHGGISWYSEHQLTLLERGRLDLLKEWERKKDARVAQAKDLNWIFSHGSDVLSEPSGATMVGLAECLGITVDQMWGRNGEGFTFYSNGLAVLSHAAPYLTSNDKAGWLAYCETFKQEHAR